MKKHDSENSYKEQNEKQELKNTYLILLTMILVFVTFLFFKPVNKWEWNWNNFFVGIYNQVLNLSLPFLFVLLFKPKNQIVKNVIFVGIFILADTFVKVEVDYLYGKALSVYLPIAIIAMLGMLLTLLMIYMQSRKRIYSRQKKIVHLFALIVFGIIAMIFTILILSIKY